MAGRIRQTDIQRVRERVDIAEVVSERVTLRNAGGGNMVGLCPFHDERSPSFNVTPARGVYHCFGCGVGGDAITFLMEADGLTFAEAVERLASKAGLQLTYEDDAGRRASGPRQKPGQRQRLLDANAAAEEFYQRRLASPEAQIARDFLTGRGFGKDAAEHFGCGYAPDSWDALTKHLRSKGFTDEDLVTAGLAKAARSGSLIDRFRGRLIWPIRDTSGSAIGFGARKLKGDDEDRGPKYLNTPETPLYKKSQVLYGIDLARKNIALDSQVVIVEGYTDVMAAHLAGVTTAVATCGTAFGSDHTRLLRRFLFDTDSFKGEIIFTFDGDEAGLRAARKAFDGDQEFMANTYVAITPEGKDPCELRQHEGDAAVRDLIATRRALAEFVLEREVSGFDLDSVEGQTLAQRTVVPILATLKDSGYQGRYIKKMATQLGVDESELKGDVQRAKGRAQNNTAPQQARRERRSSDPAARAQREALKVALQEPALAGPYFDAVDETAYTDPQYQAVRAAIGRAGGASRAEGVTVNWISSVVDNCDELAAGALVNELAVEPLFIAGTADGHYIQMLLSQIQRPVVARRVEELKSRLQRINPSTDQEDYMRLFGELVAEEKQLKALRARGSE
ncbi:DNA primase [Salininema proteolyticum]|uniref:DNA primase n=1 Tax=Salininema proteolyticum TaxID=1607685 RepID=A0ABV8TSF4_9ACTN